MKYRVCLMALGLILVLFSYSFAQVPYRINYQESLIKAPSIQVQGDEMTLSRYLIPSSEIAGYTYWEAQHKNSMRRQIAEGTDGYVYFTWMNLVGNDTTQNRYVDYNARYAFNNWLWPGGMNITPAASRGGYTGLDLLPDNREVLAYHQEGPIFPPSFWATAISIEHNAAGYGQFNSFDIPDSCASSAAKGMWPSVACPKAASGDTNFIHITMVEGDTGAVERDLAYVRCFEKPSNHDTLVCQSPGWDAPLLIPKSTRLVPNKIPFQFASSKLTGVAVATSPVSHKVAVVWLQSTGTNSTQNEVKYLESPSNGANWMATGNMGTPVQVTSYSTAGYVDRAYPDLAVVYDYSDLLHIVWTTFKSTDQNDVTLWHWSSGTGIRKISSVTAPLSVHPGSNNLLMAKPTLGVEYNSGDPAYNYLYCVYTGFKDGDASSAGYANGDLYLQASSNSGLSWGLGVNMTNSHTNGCVPPACSSEHWSSVAERVDSFLHVSYVLDRDAGTATDGEGTFTLNKFCYMPYPRPLVPVAARMEFSPTSMTDPVRQAPKGGSTQDSIKFDNMGTATLYVQLSGPSWMSISPGTFSVVEGGSTQKVNLSFNAGSFSDTLLVDSLRIISNHERVGGGLVYSDTEWVRVRFEVGLAPPATFSLISPKDLDSVMTPVNFVWHASTAANPDDTVRYDLYLSRSIVFNPDSTIVYDGLPDTTSTDSLNTRNWYWKVRAYDKWGAVRWSDQTWSFYVYRPYVYGDANGDGKITVSDVVYSVNYLFKGGPAPNPLLSADANCDGKVTVSDVIYVINYLFKGGPKPAC